MMGFELASTAGAARREESLSHMVALMLHRKQHDSGQFANDGWLACRQ